MGQYLRFLMARFSKYERIHDEEHQEGESTSYQTRPRKRPRFTCLSRTAICLLLADLVLFCLLLHTLWPLISLLLHNQELFPAQVTVTSNDTSEAFHIPKRPQIPRILHQTCKNDTIPKMWAESQKSCLKTYSDFEYKLWTDESARAFLEAEYPWFVYTWDNYPFPIQRADAIRYFVLYHYGGLYLDMDTICHEAFPIHQIESDTLEHNSLFEATLPTGITNDIMISSARHPAFESAIKLLPVSYSLTWWWAWLQPYAVIMGSTGPLFISLAVANYLYGEPSLPSPTVQVIHLSGLKPYISDLQTATWHGKDAQVLKWLSDKPLIWFILGVGLVTAGSAARWVTRKEI
ncbi:hypothetical protein FDECE_10301 [Fusarium decemcellulare]|nr:hypothetical protein FDECE_10301 [Fusarium decemcellulare]